MLSHVNPQSYSLDNHFQPLHGTIQHTVAILTSAGSGTHLSQSVQICDTNHTHTLLALVNRAYSQ